ncbi:MAG: exosortase-associated EpsI family protein [Verrucomicrobiota bacterium JB022]|nr:exosortase-associated EpsI family protein [Verrucomicrobiota bacterium JB022]
MNKLTKSVLALLALALLLTAGWYAWAETRPAPERTFDGDLAEVLPRARGGWTMEEVPLGPNEAVEEASLEILQFDDYVFRHYQGSGKDFFVYVAYWEPGKMPKRQINTHIPDVCWVNNGWTIQRRDNAYALDLGSTKTRDGQWREMDYRGQHVDVVFWHIAAGKAVTYQSMGFADKVVSIFTEPFSSGFDLRKEQFFVRVHTSGNFDQLKQDPFFREVMASLGVTSIVPTPAS